MIEKVEKYPEGHFIGMWMGIGIALFSGIGIPLSIIIDNPGFIGIGPALGVGFGLAVGQSIENKYKQQGRICDLTYDEIKRKNNMKFKALLLLIVGVFLLFIFFHFL